MKTLNLSILDMIFDDCAGVVKKVLKRILGVWHVNVSLSPSSATLYYLDSNQELQTIAQMANHYGHVNLKVLMPQHQCCHANARTVAVKNTATKSAEDLLTRLLSSVKSNIRLRL